LTKENTEEDNYQVHYEDYGWEEEDEGENEFAGRSWKKRIQFWRIRYGVAVVGFDDVSRFVVAFLFPGIRALRQNFFGLLRMPQSTRRLGADGEGEEDGRKDADILLSISTTFYVQLLRRNPFSKKLQTEIVST